MMVVHRSAATTSVRRKPYKARTRSNSGRVHTTTVNPLVWRAALELLDDNVRLDVDSSDVVYIRNRRPW
jgi:hypothetical protein